eukprot:scaffold179947_cov15-Tisochrysis_lutea.AAC.1
MPSPARKELSRHVMVFSFAILLEDSSTGKDSCLLVPCVLCRRYSSIWGIKWTTNAHLFEPLLSMH